MVWRVAPNGIINIIAGTAFAGFSGDGGPATNAQLGANARAYPAPDGSIYISDLFNGRIRRVTTDSVITTVAGNGQRGFSGDNGPATAASLDNPGDVVAASDGSIYFLDMGNFRIRRVGADGIITTFAGTGQSGDAGDGGPASQARFSFVCFCNAQGFGSLQLGPDGSLYVVSFATLNGGRLRRIGPEGIVSPVAGNGTFGSTGDGGSAQAAALRLAASALAPDGSFYFVGGTLDEAESRIRRISLSLPGFTAADISIASTDGAELYQFNSRGRHLRTVNTLTGATLFTFSYDAANRLTRVTDGDNNVTTIERDAAGNATAIVGPFGQRTTLELDVSGYLSRITDPAHQSFQFTYTANGLLTRETDPRNNTYVYTYDAQGRLVRDDDPATGFKTLARAGHRPDFNVLLNTALNRSTNYRVQDFPTGDRRRLNTLPSGLQTEFIERADGTNSFRTPDGMTELHARPRPALPDASAAHDEPDDHDARRPQL